MCYSSAQARELVHTATYQNNTSKMLTLKLTVTENTALDEVGDCNMDNGEYCFPNGKTITLNPGQRLGIISSEKIIETTIYCLGFCADRHLDVRIDAYIEGELVAKSEWHAKYDLYGELGSATTNGGRGGSTNRGYGIDYGDLDGNKVRGCLNYYQNFDSDRYVRRVHTYHYAFLNADYINMCKSMGPIYDLIID